MKPTKLRFLNKSFDVHNDDIVIYLQDELKTSSKDEVFAWRVIKNCRYGYLHPFTYSTANFISAVDKYGNYTPQIEALPGDRFTAKMDASGMVLVQTSNDECETNIQVINELEEDDIGVRISKDKNTLNYISDVSSGQSVIFDSSFTLWITMQEEISEGDLVSEFSIERAQQISIKGIKTADIVKRGGNPGPKSTRISFHLENVVCF